MSGQQRNGGGVRRNSIRASPKLNSQQQAAAASTSATPNNSNTTVAAASAASTTSSSSSKTPPLSVTPINTSVAPGITPTSSSSSSSGSSSASARRPSFNSQQKRGSITKDAVGTPKSPKTPLTAGGQHERLLKERAAAAIASGNSASISGGSSSPLSGHRTIPSSAGAITTPRGRRGSSSRAATAGMKSPLLGGSSNLNTLSPQLAPTVTMILPNSHTTLEQWKLEPVGEPSSSNSSTVSSPQTRPRNHGSSAVNHINAASPKLAPTAGKSATPASSSSSSSSSTTAAAANNNNRQSLSPPSIPSTPSPPLIMLDDGGLESHVALGFSDAGRPAAASVAGRRRDRGSVADRNNNEPQHFHNPDHRSDTPTSHSHHEFTEWADPSAGSISEPYSARSTFSEHDGDMDVILPTFHHADDPTEMHGGQPGSAHPSTSYHMRQRSGLDTFSLSRGSANSSASPPPGSARSNVSNDSGGMTGDRGIGTPQRHLKLTPPISRRDSPLPGANAVSSGSMNGMNGVSSSSSSGSSGHHASSSTQAQPSPRHPHNSNPHQQHTQAAVTTMSATHASRRATAPDANQIRAALSASSAASTSSTYGSASVVPTPTNKSGAGGTAAAGFGGIGTKRNSKTGQSSNLNPHVTPSQQQRTPRSSLLHASGGTSTKPPSPTLTSHTLPPASHPSALSLVVAQEKMILPNVQVTPVLPVPSYHVQLLASNSSSNSSLNGAKPWIGCTCGCSIADLSCSLLTTQTELLNNTQTQNEILLHYIAQLHAGLAVKNISLDAILPNGIAQARATVLGALLTLEASTTNHILSAAESVSLATSSLPHDPQKAWAKTRAHEDLRILNQPLQSSMEHDTYVRVWKKRFGVGMTANTGSNASTTAGGTHNRQSSGDTFLPSSPPTSSTLQAYNSFPSTNSDRSDHDHSVSRSRTRLDDDDSLTDDIDDTSSILTRLLSSMPVHYSPQSSITHLLTFPEVDGIRKDLPETVVVDVYGDVEQIQTRPRSNAMWYDSVEDVPHLKQAKRLEEKRQEALKSRITREGMYGLGFISNSSGVTIVSPLSPADISPALVMTPTSATSSIASSVASSSASVSHSQQQQQQHQHPPPINTTAIQNNNRLVKPSPSSASGRRLSISTTPAALAKHRGSLTSPVNRERVVGEQNASTAASAANLAVTGNTQHQPLSASRDSPRSTTSINGTANNTTNTRLRPGSGTDRPTLATERDRAPSLQGGERLDRGISSESLVRPDRADSSSTAQARVSVERASSTSTNPAGMGGPNESPKPSPSTKPRAGGPLVFAAGPQGSGGGSTSVSAVSTPSQSTTPSVFAHGVSGNVGGERTAHFNGPITLPAASLSLTSFNSHPSNAPSSGQQQPLLGHMNGSLRGSPARSSTRRSLILESPLRGSSRTLLRGMDGASGGSDMMNGGGGGSGAGSGESAARRNHRSSLSMGALAAGLSRDPSSSHSATDALSSVLHNSTGFALLAQQCTEEHSGENLSLWSAVEEFASESDWVARIHRARIIIEKHISRDAPEQINLPSQIIDDLVLCLQCVEEESLLLVDGLKTAQSIALKLLANDSYKRFISPGNPLGTQWRKYVEEHPEVMKSQQLDGVGSPHMSTTSLSILHESSSSSTSSAGQSVLYGLQNMHSSPHQQYGSSLLSLTSSQSSHHSSSLASSLSILSSMNTINESGHSHTGTTSNSTASTRPTSPDASPTRTPISSSESFLMSRDMVQLSEQTQFHITIRSGFLKTEKLLRFDTRDGTAGVYRVSEKNRNEIDSGDSNPDPLFVRGGGNANLNSNAITNSTTTTPIVGGCVISHIKLSRNEPGKLTIFYHDSLRSSSSNKTPIVLKLYVQAKTGGSTNSTSSTVEKERERLYQTMRFYTLIMNEK